MSVLKSPIAALICLALSACHDPAMVRPDLAPTSLGFDEDRVLEVTIRNQGNAEVPPDSGSLSIYIDGRPVGGYDLGRLSDQSFRAVDGEITLRTNFRMAGAGRRVGVRVDPANEIHESNEFHNMLTRSLEPPDATGPDFRIQDLSRDALGILRYTIANQGNAPSPGGLGVRVRVIVNESVAADLTPTLPPLAVGSSVTFAPSPEIPIADGDEVRVLLNTNHLLDEIDSTNNIREEVLPEPDFAPYAALLSDPGIRANIKWRRLSGTTVAYPAWTSDEQQALRQAILRRESGRPQRVGAPPSLVDGNLLTREDAWHIYLAHVAQSLWMEVHNEVDWSLHDLPDDQLAYLLDARTLVSLIYDRDYYQFSVFDVGNVTPWNPRILWQFLRNMGLIRDTPMQTILALTDWMRAHLVHMLGEESYEEVFGYPGLPPADRMLYPIPGSRHKTQGCYGTSGLYMAALRAVNIPVERGDIVLTESGGLHSRPIFLSVDRSMSHGDDPYNLVLSPAISPVPASEILYTRSEMETRFLSPAVDCDGSECNTPGEQAGYNSARDKWQAAVDNLSARPLYLFSQFGPGYLDDSLRGPRRGTMIEEYAHPFFTASERTMMVDAVEAEIRRIGGGDLEAGKDIVIDLYSRFESNR